jgi:hypothetical protein
MLVLVASQLAQAHLKKAAVLSTEYLKAANWTVNNYQFLDGGARKTYIN